MALIGNCSNVVYTDSETEFTTETKTTPDGTSVEIQVPVRVRTQTDYTNVYLVVYFIQLDRHYYSVSDESTGYDQVKVVPYRLAAYASEQARNDDPENPLFFGGEILPNYDYDRNVYEQCYEDILTREGLTELARD